MKLANIPPVGKILIDWLRQLVDWVNATARQVSAVALTGQTAAIAATALPISPANMLAETGTYRVSFYGRVTTPASISSQLGGVTIGWTNGGVSCSQAFASNVGNLTSSTVQGSLVVDADQGSSVTYACAYASVGTVMAFALTVKAEALP